MNSTEVLVRVKQLARCVQDDPEDWASAVLMAQLLLDLNDWVNLGHEPPSWNEPCSCNNLRS